MRRALSVFVLPVVAFVLQGGVAAIDATLAPSRVTYAAAQPHLLALPALPEITTTTVAEHRALNRANRRVVAATRVPAVASTSLSASLSDLLDRLANCESGRNPRAVGGGGKFFGAFQDTLETWHGIGGTGNPIDFDYATQKALNARIPVSAWHRQFPVCSRRIGV